MKFRMLKWAGNDFGYRSMASEANMVTTAYNFPLFTNIAPRRLYKGDSSPTVFFEIL